MSAVVTLAVAALSAITAVASFFAYLYYVRRSGLVAAREEALALAETRRQVIAELRDRLRSVEERSERDREYFQRRNRELQAALGRTRAQARKDAYRTQHFYAAALSDLASALVADLERTPPDIQRALARIRKLLPPQLPAEQQGSTLES